MSLLRYLDAPAQPVAAPPRHTPWWWLVLLMQIKDTVAIVLLTLNGLLFFGIIGGVGIPGLVLYARRWKYLKPETTPARGFGLVTLSLLYEVAWAWTFLRDATSPRSGGPDNGPDDSLPHYAGLYWLGAALCAGQLLTLICCSGRWPHWHGLPKRVRESALVAIAYIGFRLVLLLTLVGERPPLPDIPPHHRPLLWLQLVALLVANGLLGYFSGWRLAAGLWATRQPLAAHWRHWALLLLLGLFLLGQAHGLWGLGNCLANSDTQQLLLLL